MKLSELKTIRKINCQKIKKDFFKNNPQLVYLDTAATALKPQVVIDAINNYYQNFSINSHSHDYALVVEATRICEETRALISKFINAHQQEIVFSPSATFAYNQIVASIGQYLQADDEVVLTKWEHASLLLPFYRLQQTHKIKLKFLETDLDSVITTTSLQEVLSPKTKVVAFANINNSVAAINDVKMLTNYIKNYGRCHQQDSKWPFANIIVLIDGAQSVGHFPTDVQGWGIDFFAFSAQKVFGPTGIAAWWAKSKWLALMEPLIIGGGMNGRIYSDGTFTIVDAPTRFEGGSPNIAGIFGFKAALQYLMNIGLNNIHQHERLIKQYAIKQLQANFQQQVIIYNCENDAGILIFNVVGIMAEDVANYLSSQNICLRSGNFCSKLWAQVINAPTALRISFYVYTTTDDIDQLILALKKGFDEGGDFLNAFF